MGSPISKTGLPEASPYYPYPALPGDDSGPSAPPAPWDSEGTVYVEATVVGQGVNSSHSFQNSAPFLDLIIHRSTEDLLREMENVADKALGKQASPPEMSPTSPSSNSRSRGVFSSISTAPINIDSSDRSWRWGNRTEVHHHHHGDGETSKSKSGGSSSNDTAIRVLVGAVGLIGAGIASYLIGKTCAQGEDASRVNSTYEELKGSWNRLKQEYILTDQQSIDRLIKKTDYLKGREKANRIQKLALYALMFIAGAAALGGAIVRSRMLVRSAAVIGAFTLIAALFKYGYASFSKGHLDEARKIKNELIGIRESFRAWYRPSEVRAS